MKKIYKIIGLLLLVTLIVVGCSSEDTGTKQAEEGTAQSEEETDQKVDLVKEDEEKEDKQEEKEDKKDDLAGEVKSKVLIDMMNSKENTTEIKVITKMGGQETESLITTAISGDKVYSSTKSGSTSMRFIEKEDKSYLIMDESKTIIASNRYEEDREMDLTSQNLVYDDLKYVGKGTEEFLGNQRPYEEYNIELGSVKYYFDGNKLDGMQILIDMSNMLDDELDEEELEGIEGMIPKEANIKMKILSYEKKVDNSLFELPEGYQVVGQ